ncbi:hypothetical protein BDW60DRAFT_191873 [Aspergillus nidulans var. acristatus]
MPVLKGCTHRYMNRAYNCKDTSCREEESANSSITVHHLPNNQSSCPRPFERRIISYECQPPRYIINEWDLPPFLSVTRQHSQVSPFRGRYYLARTPRGPSKSPRQ